jgi:hypothetical protein
LQQVSAYEHFDYSTFIAIDMKKFIPLLFGVCTFTAYQIFFFCFINIISYQACGARLSVQANILSLSLNILVILLLLSFCYFFCNAARIIKSDKLNSKFAFFASSFFICWIFASVIAATRDIYYGNQVNTIFEYFITRFKEAQAILWFMIFSLSYVKFMGNPLETNDRNSRSGSFTAIFIRFFLAICALILSTVIHALISGAQLSTHNLSFGMYTACCMVACYCYFLRAMDHRDTNNKLFNKSEFAFWASAFFICWIFASVIAATRDIYYGNQVNTIFEYFTGQFKIVQPIIWFMICSALYDKIHNEPTW